MIDDENWRAIDHMNVETRDALLGFGLGMLLFCLAFGLLCI